MNKGVTRFRQLINKIANGTKKKALFYYASSSLFCQFLRFLGILITTRILAPEQFGLFAEATLIISLTTMTREIGQTGALVAYQGKDIRYTFFNFQLNALLGLISAVLTFGSTSLIKIIPPEIRELNWVLVAIILCESLTLTNTLALQKRFRFKALGVVEIICLIVWLLTICLLIGKTSGLVTLLYAQLAEVLIRSTLLFCVAGLQFTGFSTGKDLLHYYFYRFTRPVIPLVIIQGIQSRIDYLLLSFFSTRLQLGYYERLGQFSKIPMSLTINLCDKVLMHSYSDLQSEPSFLKKILNKSMTVLLIVTTIILAVVTVSLIFIFPHLIGVEWCRELIKLWWNGIPFFLLLPILANINLFFSGIGMQFQLVKNSLFNLMSDLIVGLILVIPFGATGMLLAKSISIIVVAIYQLRTVRGALVRNASVETVNLNRSIS